jgi:hypothetical protein
MQDTDMAIDADDTVDELEVADDPVDPYDDDPPPPFSGRPPEAVVDDSVGDDEEPIDPTEDAVNAHAEDHH